MIKPLRQYGMETLLMEKMVISEINAKLSWLLQENGVHLLLRRYWDEGIRKLNPFSKKLASLCPIINFNVCTGVIMKKAKFMKILV